MKANILEVTDLGVTIRYSHTVAGETWESVEYFTFQELQAQGKARGHEPYDGSDAWLDAHILARFAEIAEGPSYKDKFKIEEPKPTDKREVK